MRLTDEMHDAVKNSEVGRYIDRLIVADVADHPEFSQGWRGNVIQALWEAFMSGHHAVESDGPSFREIKQEIKNGPSV